MSTTQIKLSTNQRPFVMIYQDFLESELLNNHYQKLIYIYLKKFADSNNQCFPSIKTIARLTKISVSKVKQTLVELEEKGVISKENRIRKDGGKSTNRYTLYDYKELWKAKNVEEVEIAKENNFVNLKDVSTEALLKELEKRNKKNVPEATSQPTKVTVVETSTNAKANSFVENDCTPIETDCQTIFNDTDEKVNENQIVEVEEYTYEEIKEIYDYDVMVEDEPTKQEDIDNVIEILHDTLNTKKPTIRIEGQNKPTQVVINKLLKLDKDCLLYAIDKFNEQTDRIKNPTGYMLTLLYKSKEQMNLDMNNRIQHDMYNNSAMYCNNTGFNCDTQKSDVIEANDKNYTSQPLNHRFNAFPQQNYIKDDYREIEKQPLQKTSNEQMDEKALKKFMELQKKTGKFISEQIDES